MVSTPIYRVAVLYQSFQPPGSSSHLRDLLPTHLGGYKESSADIAWNLKQCHDIEVITPTRNPKPTKAEEWCFPDTEDGIVQATEQGATYLWANTNLFDEHPLQVSNRLNHLDEVIRVVGQSPVLQQDYEHKVHVNRMLSESGCLRLPRIWDLSKVALPNLPGVLESLELPFPVVAKPVCGRGGWGVKVCDDLPMLHAHVQELVRQKFDCMLEQHLWGQEASVVVLPPHPDAPHSEGYHCLGIHHVAGHLDGVAPCLWKPAMANLDVSVPTWGSMRQDCEAILDECEIVARCLGALAPIRIDVRQARVGGKYAIFDVNMKLSWSSPGRPGRETQSNTALKILARKKAETIDWKVFLRKMLERSSTLKTLRETQSGGLRYAETGWKTLRKPGNRL